jgi:hypothetical protein
MADEPQPSTPQARPTHPSEASVGCVGFLLGAGVGAWLAHFYEETIPGGGDFGGLQRLYGLLIALIILVPLGGLLGGLVLMRVVPARERRVRQEDARVGLDQAGSDRR